jgi:hypothetical protein
MKYYILGVFLIFISYSLLLVSYVFLFYEENEYTSPRKTYYSSDDLRSNYTIWHEDKADKK